MECNIAILNFPPKTYVMDSRHHDIYLLIYFFVKNLFVLYRLVLNRRNVKYKLRKCIENDFFH